jgi:hypothetical protein
MRRTHARSTTCASQALLHPRTLLLARYIIACDSCEKHDRMWHASHPLANKASPEREALIGMTHEFLLLADAGVSLSDWNSERERC